MGEFSAEIRSRVGEKDAVLAPGGCSRGGRKEAEVVGSMVQKRAAKGVETTDAGSLHSRRRVSTIGSKIRCRWSGSPRDTLLEMSLESRVIFYSEKRLWALRLWQFGCQSRKEFASRSVSKRDAPRTRALAPSVKPCVVLSARQNFFHPVNIPALSAIPAQTLRRKRIASRFSVTESSCHSIKRCKNGDRIFGGYRLRSNRMKLFAIIHGFLRPFLLSRSQLVLENLALRQQLAMLSRQRPRPTLRRRDRLFWVCLSKWWSGWRSVLVVVQPDTVIRWHQQGFRLWWRWKSRTKRVGRPPLAKEVRDLIGQMARDNSTWGAPRTVADQVGPAAGVTGVAVRLRELSEQGVHRLAVLRVEPLLEVVVLRLCVAGEDVGDGCIIHAGIYPPAFHFHRQFPGSGKFLPYAFTGSFFPRPMYRQTVRNEIPNAVAISGAVSPLSRSS